MAIYTDYETVQTTKTDAAAINDAIKNIILTPKGSLPGKPTFGSNIHKIIFSQLDDISESDLKIYITESLSQWEPRILIDTITVKSLPEFNKITATIQYIYRDKGLVLNERLTLSLSS